ncbi:MAG: aldehyde dehydrogenase [Elusimicrobia bacterium]|nr:aldehyde dehydrogenase [Elusimicrobiota bacterium]
MSPARLESILNYADGRLTPPASGRFLDNFAPARGALYGRVPDSDERDMERAVAAASRAFPSWSAKSATERASWLRKIGDAIESRAAELARAESQDTGKPLSLASVADIPRSALNFRFFADAITQFSSECHSTDQNALNYTLRQPLGVVACISPWNLPLYLLTWKIAPALAMGNCVVAKPSELTPLSAHRLSLICRELGLPAGVLNIVHGTGRKAGAALVAHPKVAAVSFTGSTKTGADIAKAAAPAFKKLSLEMGGKNPNIVFSDCDFEEAVEGSLKAAFLNQGQICLCGSRIFVEKALYPRFKRALVERAKALKVGDPEDPDTDQGALVSETHLEKIESYVRLARQAGGRVLCGGRRAAVNGRCRGGWFYEPTLIEGLGPEHQINQDEIFGPVATLIPFRDEAELVDWANRTRYGLAAVLWTKDIGRAHRIAAKLQSGIIWINCWMLRDLRTPFGGMKESGLGREGGLEALRFFSETKNVCVKL